MKRTPIRRVSKKRAKALNEYSRLASEFLRNNPTCEVCGEASEVLHHKRGRGIFLTDIRFFMAACNQCHNYIHRNPMWARRLGYMLDRIGHE